MVSAAKLRRAQMAVMGSRPYADKLGYIVTDILAQSEELQKNPLFKKPEEVKKVEILVFTSNRGLCGGFNSSLLRKTETFLRRLEKEGKEFRLLVVGKKGREFFKARGREVHDYKEDWAVSINFDQAIEYTQSLVNRYVAGEFDEFYLVYNKFISAISQEETFEKFFPLEMTQEETYGIDYIYEPNKAEILEALLPKFLATQLYKAHLESLASELGARMTAMDNASKNAKEMIGGLTLQYNRLRQAAITTELMDIVNGAEAIS